MVLLSQWVRSWALHSQEWRFLARAGLASSDGPLLRIFRAYGKVLAINIQRKEPDANGDHQSWALVTFTDAAGLENALASDTAVDDDAGHRVELATRRANVQDELQKDTTGALAGICSHGL
jgi:hypothetical protein